MILSRGAQASALSLMVAFLVAEGCGGKPEVYRETEKTTPDAGVGGRGSGSSDAGIGGSVLEIPDSGVSSSCGDACADSSVAEPTCGDGLVNQAGERCDDGNTTSGDGCTAGCEQIEADFACP